MDRCLASCTAVAQVMKDDDDGGDDGFSVSFVKWHFSIVILNISLPFLKFNLKANSNTAAAIFTTTTTNNNNNN